MNDIFSIFNPDWWMDENNNALQMTDAVLFLLLAIPVAYLFIYALASLRKYKNPYPPSPKRHRFLVLFVVLTVSILTGWDRIYEGPDGAILHKKP